MNKNNNQFLVFALLSIILILSVSFVSAVPLPANPTAPTLGEAGRFVILASQKVTTTGTSASAITGGNIGIEDQARSYYEGFTPGANPGQFTELTNGLSYAHDDTDSSLNGGYPSTIAFIDQVRTDLGNAYTFLGADPNPTAPTQVSPTELGTLTLTRGVYKTDSNVGITTGPLYLDAQGDPNSVFIFSIGGILTIGAPSGAIILQNGAQAKNVYFVTGGKTVIEAGRSVYGNIFSFEQINLLDSATITGRLYSVNEQVTLISNAVTAPSNSNSTQLVLTRIVLFPSQSTMNIGSILTLNATGFDQFNNSMVTNISFVSSNSSVATVNATSGLVTAVYTGNAIITAFNGNVNATDTITVNAPTIPAVLTTINFSQTSANVNVGSSLQLNATGYDQYNHVISAVIGNYISSNSSVVTVNSTTGIVTAVSVGNATITATSGEDISATTIINVETVPVTVDTTSPSSSSSGGGSSDGASGGGGIFCSTQWTCSDYSVCSNGIQTRSCSYPTNSCTPNFARPIESQSCTVSISDTTNPISSNPTTGGAGITGAAISDNIKKVGSSGWIIVILLVAGIGALVFVLFKPV